MDLLGCVDWLAGKFDRIYGLIEMCLCAARGCAPRAATVVLVCNQEVEEGQGISTAVTDSMTHLSSSDNYDTCDSGGAEQALAILLKSEN